MSSWQDKEEKTVKLFARVEEVIRQTFDNENGMKDYLDFYIQVPGYSVHNTAMMKAQRSDAQLAGSFQFWKEQGLYIRRGEQGMAILVPAKGEDGHTAFTLRYIFDINQTNASEEKRNELLSAQKSEYSGERNYDSLFTAIFEAAAQYKIKINYLRETVPESEGEVYYKDNTIFLPQKQEMSKQLGQAIRLLSMALLERKEKWMPAQIHLQADIVQYLLYKNYGLNTSELHFTELIHQDIRMIKISEKKKLLGDAFEVAAGLKKQIDHNLTQIMQKETSEKSSIDWRTGEALPADGNIIENVQEKPSEIPAAADKEKIEDFGKKIGGARKDLWKERGLDISDIAEMNEAEAAKYITKDNIWKKPDYAQMIQDGTPVRVAYFIKEVRNSLPVKVEYSYMDTTKELRQKRQEDYISLIRDVKELLLKAKDEVDILHVFDEFVKSGTYVKQATSYAVQKTEKGFAVTNKMLKAMQIRQTDFRRMDYRIEKEQFGVAAEEKLPKGFSVRYLQPQEAYVVLKGRTILAEGIKSWPEAVKKAKELHKEYGGARKTKYVPKQLEHIVRDGPSNGITGENPANGIMYMEDFGFAGGEFGNWMNESDRQTSLNMGYDAFCDLAAALDMDMGEISLANRLSIAFGARGHGSAVAHYEPLREVINLTKMRGAGSLAHEWGHAFDNIMGKQLGLNGFMTENIRDERVPESVKDLLETMKYRLETEEEVQLRNEKVLEQTQKCVDGLLKQILPEERLDDTQKKEWERLKEEIKSTAQERSTDVQTEEQDDNRRVKWISEKIEELSKFRKSATGHGIVKDIRNQLYYATYTLECAFRGSQEKKKVETEFYKNSVRADSVHSKEDNGYWHSNVEMFARAFACYVHDKLPWRSDYLCGHSEMAGVWDFSKGEAKIIKTFPEGEERERINQCFDDVFVECKKLGLIKAADKEREGEVQVRKMRKCR